MHMPQTKSSQSTFFQTIPLIYTKDAQNRLKFLHSGAVTIEYNNSVLIGAMRIRCIGCSNTEAAVTVEISDNYRVVLLQ